MQLPHQNHHLKHVRIKLARASRRLLIVSASRPSATPHRFPPSVLSPCAMSDWSDEETDDPHYADRRNFYKVEKCSRDGLRV
jgi:hypothetical protein